MQIGSSLFLFFLKMLTGTSFAAEKEPEKNRIKIAIIGAGSVGAMLADELQQNPNATYEPVCFVDIDKGKVGRELYHIPVLMDGDSLQGNLAKLAVQEVVFALPNVNELVPRQKRADYRRRRFHRL